MRTAKGGRSATPSHEDSQRCYPSPPKGPKQSTSVEVSLSPASSDKDNFINSSLNQEGFKCPTPLGNGLRSSLRAQRELSPTTIPQVSLTPLIPAQAQTKVSTPIPGPQGPLPSLEGTQESSIYPQEVLATPESAQGILGPSEHTQRSLGPLPSSLGVLSSSISVEGTPGLSTSREKSKRPILSHKQRFKSNPAMKRDPGPSLCRKRRLRDPPSKQGNFTVSFTDQEGFNHPLPAKMILPTCYWAPNRHTYSKTLSVSQASSNAAQDAETIQPSLHPQESLQLSTYVGEALGISTYTPGTPEHSPPVQDSLGSALSDKATIGEVFSHIPILGNGSGM